VAKRDKWKDAANKRDGGGFLAMPYSVINGAAYISLSAYARMLLLDLYAQYKGKNNGDLCAAYSMMKLRGWKSQHTLQKAKKELLDAELICETRKGARPNKASLYAVTWHDLDDCGGKLDITPRGFNRSAYRLKDPPPAIGKINTLNAASASKNTQLLH